MKEAGIDNTTITIVDGTGKFQDEKKVFVSQ